ncbi:MAG: ComF family protein [Christensenellaceae bacterium]|jgi:competence protein ComFC
MKPFDLLEQLFESGAQCAYCGREIPKSGRAGCMDCEQALDELKNKDGFAGGVLYVYQYDGPVKKLIHSFKYNDQPWLGSLIAQLMYDFLADYEVDVDVITYVPVHENRRKQRGFDQAELMAHRLAMLMDIPAERLIGRVRDTKPQYDLTEKKRAMNVRDAFAPVARANIDGRNILLLDDIYTTGSTVAECIRALDGADVTPFVFSRD